MKHDSTKHTGKATKDYLVTVEVRMKVPAIGEPIAKQNAIVACLDPESVARLGVEWLGQDVVCCVEDK